MKLLLPVFVGNTSGAVLQLPAQDFTQTTDWSTLCYSGIKIGSDGELYARQDEGGWYKFSTWLVSGTAGNYYLSVATTSGSLTTDAGGTPAVPLVLSSDRIYDVQSQSKLGPKVWSGIFSIWSDDPGTALVVSAGYTFSADSVFT